MLLNNLDIFDYLLNKKCSGGGELVKVKDATCLFSFCNNTRGGFGSEVPHDYQYVADYINLSDFSECTNYRRAFMYSNGPNGIIDCQKFTNVRTAKEMFYYCDVVEIRNLDLSKVTELSYTFADCLYLKYIPETINFEEVTDLRSTFVNCREVLNLPSDIRIPKCRTMFGTFSGVNIEDIDFHKTTINVMNMSYTFEKCSVLKNVRGLSMKSCTECTGVFDKCSSLEELEIFDISKSLTIGSGTSWGHKLTLDSLIHTIQELRGSENGSTSLRTLTIGSANLEKITDVYVKVIDETDTLKLPFEVCESTDEGAMLITEYALLKNWQMR